MIGTLNQSHLPDPFRSSHIHHNPMSYPRTLPTLDFDVPAPSTSRFPISSVRPEAPQNCSANPPANPPKLVYPRYDPLHILSQPPTPARPIYPVTLPAHPVAPGVLADGVLTAMLPSVREFLQSATLAPPACPPLPKDNRVLALAALSVFYRPLHPAHWVFWNKEQKKATATVVQTVLDITPTPILSPIGWIAISEMLWILASMQHAYGPALAPLSWYATYVPAEPENRMNLRKRKAPTILAPAPADNAASGDETVDEDERITPPPLPPRKRAKTRRSGAVMTTTTTARPSLAVPTLPPTATETVDLDEEEGPKEAEHIIPTLLFTADAVPPTLPPTTLTKEAKRERIASPTLAVSASVMDNESVRVLDGDMAEVVDAEVDVPEVRKSVRQRERRERVAAASTSDSPASVVSALTPSVRARGLDRGYRAAQGQGQTSSRASSSVSLESVGGGESGSSTAVSLYDEEGMKPKSASASAKSVVTVIESREGADGDEDDDEDINDELPVTKKARTAAQSRPSAKAGSRARQGPKNRAAADDGDGVKTSEVARARPRARARASKTRRR